MGIRGAVSRAVFLDRDGVINRPVIRDGKPFPPSSAAELEILPDAPAALSRLRNAGFRLVVVTNQPDVARGTRSREEVERIHAALKSRLPLDGIRTCYHDDPDGCACRKPKPGLLVDAAREMGVDLKASYMVGDRWRDIEAGRSAGCATVFIDRGYTERRPSGYNVRVESLAEAAEWIESNSKTETRRMKRVEELNVKIFADGADREGMLQMYAKPYIKGFTTNPTLMRKAGVTDYRAFARDIIRAIPDRSISFEVFSDEFPEMERQGMEIASWGPNVYVKVPITNTRREPAYDLITRLSRSGVKLNVTAMTTMEQVEGVAASVSPGTPCYFSVFAGRIADTGVDPLPLMTETVRRLKTLPEAEVIWASPRELLNVFQADAIGCQIITVTNDILKKLALVGKDLNDYSLETVKMFYDDAQKAGFEL